jgi:cystathionine gamma-lyase
VATLAGTRHHQHVSFHPHRDGTRVVRAGRTDDADGEPLASSPVLTSTYRLAGDPHGPYQYGRVSNPTWSALESALAELEQGEVVVFSSGMAAVTAALFTTLRAGSVLLLPDDCYYANRTLANGLLSDLGVVVRTAPSRTDELLAQLDGVSLLWLEVPTNPRLDVVDVRRLASAAHDAGALVAVDTTTATPLGLPALTAGADLAVASDTKALSGHSDLLLGHIATRDSELAGRIRSWRTSTGAIPGPFEAWLAHRSLATLDVRLARQAANGLAVAQLLASNPAAAEVKHPWLPSDPSFAVTTELLRRGNGLVSFTLADQTAAEEFLRRSRLLAEATSFGGVHSTAERRARWGGDDVPPGFVRLSCGIEDTADLVEDIAHALAQPAVASASRTSSSLVGEKSP